MTTFKYKGIGNDGTNIDGIIRAYDEFEAVTRLRENLSVITKIEAIADSDDKAKKKKIKLKDKDLSIMASQFAIILTSGMPVVRCIEMVAEQSEDKGLRDRLLKVAEDVDGGISMATALETDIPELPSTFVETVRAGEQAGTMETCFKRLEKYYDRAAKTRGKVSGALTYPAIVISVGIIVFIIIITVAVPMFTDVFAGLGVELPFLTRLLIGLSDFFRGYWWILAFLIAGGLLFFKLKVRTDEGREKFDAFKLFRMPLHSLTQMNCASDFAATMSTMLGAGLPMIQALDVTANVVTNYRFAKAIEKVRGDVEMGKGIADSMRATDCFPNLLTEMTGVGERSGAMEATLDVVSDYYTNEVQVKTDKLMSALEPAITIGLAVMVVILLLAVYMPMFSMYGSI